MEDQKKKTPIKWIHLFASLLVGASVVSAFFLEVEKLELLFDFFMQMMQKALLID